MRITKKNILSYLAPNASLTRALLLIGLTSIAVTMNVTGCVYENQLLIGVSRIVTGHVAYILASTQTLLNTKRSALPQPVKYIEYAGNYFSLTHVYVGGIISIVLGSYSDIANIFSVREYSSVISRMLWEYAAQICIIFTWLCIGLCAQLEHYQKQEREIKSACDQVLTLITEEVVRRSTLEQDSRESEPTSCLLYTSPSPRDS